MQRAENAKVTPSGTGAQNTQHGDSATPALALRLPSRLGAQPATTLPTDSSLQNFTLSDGATRAPRLAELFGKHQNVVNTAVKSTGDADVVIGIPLTPPARDSQVISRRDLPASLRRGSCAAIPRDSAPAHKTVQQHAVTIVRQCLTSPQTALPHTPLSIPNNYRQTQDSGTIQDTGMVRTRSIGPDASTASSVTALKNALLAAKEGAPREQHCRGTVAALLPKVASLTGSSNVFMQAAAQAVLAIVNETLQGAPVSSETLGEASRRVALLEKGAGTVTHVEPKSALGSPSSTLHKPTDHTAPAQLERTGVERLLELGRESLNIVSSLQGIQGRQAPNHLLSRVAQVMATTVARHVAALSRRIGQESISVAQHLTELSRSLSAIASRPGRVDLSAFSLRLEGLLLVLTLHSQAPRGLAVKDVTHAASTELSQQISRHLLALQAQRTGRRIVRDSDRVWHASDALPESANEQGGGLFVDILMSGSGRKPALFSSSDPSEAEQLARILRATPL